MCHGTSYFFLYTFPAPKKRCGKRLVTMEMDFIDVLIFGSASLCKPIYDAL